MWLQFSQVFLHTRRFKLERSNGASVAIELISGRVFNIQAIYIHSNAQTVLDIFHGFFQDGQGFQSKEVHLDESRFLNHVSVILRTAQFFTRELLIIGSGNRYPITNIIPANNRSASMHTRIANVVLQHLSIADGISQQRVGRSGSSFQLRHTFQHILQIHLPSFWQTVGNAFAERIGLIEWILLHACHILDSEFGSHRTISDDMRHLFRTIFIGHPLQHLSTSVIIEIHINIRKRDTVRVQETLKQQVVLDWVHLRDT